MSARSADLDAAVRDGASVSGNRTDSLVGWARHSLPMLAPFAIVSVAAAACWGLGQLSLEPAPAPAVARTPAIAMAITTPVAALPNPPAALTPAVAPVNAAPPVEAAATAELAAARPSPAETPRRTRHERAHAILAAADVSTEALAVGATVPPPTPTLSPSPASPVAPPDQAAAPTGTAQSDSPH